MEIADIPGSQTCICMLVPLLRSSMLLGSSARLVGLGNQLGFLATIPSNQDTQVLQKVLELASHLRYFPNVTR